MAHSTGVSGLIPGSRFEAPDVHPINSRLERHSWQNPGKRRKFLAPKNLPAIAGHVMVKLTTESSNTILVTHRDAECYSVFL